MKTEKKKMKKMRQRKTRNRRRIMTKQSVKINETCSLIYLVWLHLPNSTSCTMQKKNENKSCMFSKAPEGDANACTHTDVGRNFPSWSLSLSLTFVSVVVTCCEAAAEESFLPICLFCTFSFSNIFSFIIMIKIQ